MGWEVFNKNVQYKVGVGDRVIFLSIWLFQPCTILLQIERHP